MQAFFKVLEHCDQAVTHTMFSILTFSNYALYCGDYIFSCAVYLRLAMFPWKLLVYFLNVDDV